MMLELALSDGALVVRDVDRQLRGKHAAQLNFWQFRYDRDAKAYRTRVADVGPVAQKVIDYFASQHLPIEVKPEVTAACSRATAEQSELREALAFGREIKDGGITNDRVRSFVEFAARKLARPLKQHQLKASVHLLAITNGAN